MYQASDMRMFIIVDLVTQYISCRMRYTEACIWENWRHVTNSPMGLDRIAASNVQLNGYQIPKVS